MLNIIQNTIGAIRRVGESVVRAGLKMWLPFTKADVGATTQTTPDISGNDNNAILKTGKALVFAGNDSVETVFPSSKDIKTIAFWIYPTHSASGETLFYFGGTGQGTKFLYLDHLTLRKDSFGGMDFSVYVDGVYRGNTYESSNYVTLAQDQWQRVVLTTSTAYNTISDTFDVAYKGFGSHGRFKMSDLQIYGAEFTTDDIAYDYANPQKLVTDNASSNVTLNDLHAWWHMSEGNGTIAFDSAPLLGKELLNNPINETNWTVDEGWTADNGIATRNGGSVVDRYLRQSISGLVNGNVYKVSFTISNLSTPTTTIGISSSGFLGNVSSSERFVTENGDYSITGTYDNQRVNPTELRFVGGANTTFSVSNISVKEVFNIDGETYDGSSLGATYDDAQERIPQLGMMNWSKGSNVLTNSNDFQASPWSSAYVVFDDGYEAPDGTMTAWKITRDGAQGYGAVYDQTVTPNIGVVRSIYAKTVSGTGNIHLMNNNNNTNSLVTVTNDWQRFSITSGSTAAGNFYAVDFRGSSTLTEVIVWGAQEEVNLGDSLSAFRKTNGTAVTDATLISCATDSQKDILGNAVRVKGSGFNLDGAGYGEVEHSTDFDFGTGNFSVSAWVKFSYIAKGSTFNAIYTNGGSVVATNTFSLISHSDMKLLVFVNASYCISTTTFNQGEWVHVVATRNSGTISLYINGNKTPEDTVTNSNSVTSGQNPIIGFDGTSTRFYDDIIDDVQVYDEALTPDEVEQNYNATKSGHNN